MDQHSPHKTSKPSTRTQTDLGSCVHGLVNTLAKGEAELVAPHGLLPLEYAILKLFLSQERWTVTQMTDFLPVKTPRISHVVNALVHRGLIRRRRQRTDRRVVILTLSEEGRTLAEQLHQRVRCYEAALSEGVSNNEMEAFASLTSKIIANYSALANT